MDKKAYAQNGVTKEIVSATKLLLEVSDTSPTDVLRLAKLSESPDMRTLVCELAILSGFRVISSGTGYRIKRA